MRASPPGPKGLPVVGNTYHYARDPFTFMRAVERAYGDIAALSLGGRRTFMVAAPDPVERVLVTDASRYGKPTFGDDAVGELLGEGLLLSEGEFWREQRERVRPAFGPKRIAALDSTITKYAREVLDGWAEGEVVDVRAAMARLTVRVIVEAMFGVELDRETAARVQSVLEPVGARFEPDPVRFLSPDWVPTTENRRFRDGVDTLEDVLDDLVARRRERGVGEDDDDMLALLLCARDRGELSARRLRDELMTMLLAGHDTTALALTYTWYLLSEHPGARERVHAELDDVLGGATPTTAGVRDLEYTDRVLTESMRLYPPVYAMFREPRVDSRLAGYRVPAGSLVMLSQWAVHRSSRYYDDPGAFDPDRWVAERARERPDFAYFPFGGGPRVCIGRRLALLEAKLVLATVAREYALERVKDGPLELRPSLTMHPRDPVEMRLRARGE